MIRALSSKVRFIDCIYKVRVAYTPTIIWRSCLSDFKSKAVDLSIYLTKL